MYLYIYIVYIYIIYIYYIYYIYIYYNIYYNIYIYNTLSTTQLDWIGRGKLQCSVHQKKMVDLTQDLKAERNKTYNVKHEPKRIREIQTSWIILEWTTSRHLQRISKQILITPIVRHFSIFSNFPSEKKTQLKNSRVPKNTWSENRVSQKPLVDHYSLS